LSDRELRDELVTVMGAGHETTATALAWAVERLIRTPRVLARARESLAEGETDYLDAVVKETLRTRPVITDVVRKLTEPAEIGGYRLPAGTLVLPAILIIHHREDLYPQPLEFRPERFLEGQGEGFTWIPFGGGVRRCIGAAFAQYEMRIALSAILQRADLRAADAAPERMRPRNITLAPHRGARVILRRPIATAKSEPAAAFTTA
jgi:cytochrome P450